ncbi:MAG: hypothetical protein P0Y63_04075 [Klebsiella huaxiensis]|uniref:hypothetical protein n=1 Tax=Klebsiella huaxiensis TaxID=2153354 RepID=UPI0026EE7376|nr:hypothetical protein [Klebsiella huaxiensis]WEJ90204.1 MAG: hypothetical protein P0Y63_04075 [Klebsiella huaxiensis]
MTSKLTITRERLEWISQISGRDDIEDVDGGEIRELARAQLAAMDSEPVAWQIHTPETGVTYVETNPKSVENIRNGFGIKVEITPLYRHAQQPVVPDERAAFNAWNNDVDCPLAGRDAKSAAWMAWNYRAMLQAGTLTNEDAILPVTQLRPVSDLYGITSPTGSETMFTFDPVEASNLKVGGWSVQEYVELERLQEAVVGNSPVIPEGYVMVPIRLTAENGAKGALSGEFSETKFVNCPECFGDDECETCDGSGRIEITAPVTWTTIKEIWAKGVEHFAAAPQEVQGDS